MGKPLRVLLIEDAEDDALLLLRQLRRGGYTPIWERVDTAQALRGALEKQSWDVVLADYSMPRFSAPEALTLLKECDLDLPFIIVSGAVGEESAVAAMRAGAHDFLIKGQTARLIPAIERELQEAISRRARKRAEEQRAFLIELSTVLSASLDYQTTLTNLVRLVVPYLADYCIVDTVEEYGQLQRAATAHANPSKEALMHKLQQFYSPDPQASVGVAQVLRSGKAIVTTQIEDAQLQAAAQDEEHLRLLRELGPRSAIMTPMLIRGRVLGVITFAMTESGRRYDSDDLLLVEEVARRAALAVDNARLYREAQEARIKAERAVQVRDQFLSIAAHELRTPLTSLKGYAELFQRRSARDGSLKERDRHALQVIVDQAERLNKMVCALLDLSRIQMGQLSIDCRPINLVDLVRRLAEEIRPTLVQHTLQLDYPKEAVLINGDELRLEQVLQNLIQNAIKYSPDGGTIEVAIKLREDYACIVVTDEGIGIPAAAIPQLFQRFYRAVNVETHQISGMGIGLYVVKEIIVLHGGLVEVESIEGRGSTFTICLPWPSPSDASADVLETGSVGVSP